jgi:DNA excision repair protein ERCC-5
MMQRTQYEGDIDAVTDEMKDEVVRLLQLFGVPYMKAPAEAEAQCVALEELGLVNGIVTEDSDVFVFGGKVVYKNIFEEAKYAEVYRASDAEREMKLGKNQMVALAMLLGGDYTDGVKGVGIVNAMEVLEAFDVSDSLKAGLERFRKWLDGFDPWEGMRDRVADDSSFTKEKRFMLKHKGARQRWIAPDSFPSDRVMNAYTNPVVDKSRSPFSWAIPDVDGLLEFCSQNIGWPADETKRFLDPVMTKLSSSKRQTRIDSFFTYEDSVKFADVRSKRLRTVLGMSVDSKDSVKKAAKKHNTESITH